MTPATFQRWSTRYGAVFLCAVAVSVARGENSQWQERLDLSILYDSNVLEATSAAQADMAVRLLADLGGGGRSSPNVSWAAQYRGGIEVYKGHAIENRLVNDMLLSISGRLGPRLSAGVAGQGRGKLFFKSDRDYITYRIWPSVSWAASPRTSGRLFVIIAQLDFHQGDYFDFQQTGAGFSCERRFSERLAAKLQYVFSEFRHDRPALDFRLVDANDYEWIELDRRQKDSRQEITGFLELYRWALLQGAFSYTANRSNSYGYAYDSLKIHLLLAKSLPWDLTVRFYTTLLLKWYRDDLQPLLQVRADIENEEDSHTLLDLVKDLKKQVSLRIRLGYYRNESPFRELYYEKWSLSAGVGKWF